MSRQERGGAMVAGGGTAGHVMPGIAIAHALDAVGLGPIHYVGAERGIEARLVPDEGFELTLLPGRGIERRLSLQNVGAVAGLVRALGRAVLLVARRRPAVVVAMGGYASVAIAFAARLLRIPVIVHEQNARPGAANRLVSRFAAASAVSFPATPLPRAVVTGNPVRPAIVAVGRTRSGPDAGDQQRRAKAALGHDPDRVLVVVVGGSLGALRLNRAVLDALPLLAGRSDLTIRHIVGERDWELVAGRADPPDDLAYRPIRYEDDMPGVLAAADLQVSRAGSSSCFELAASGVPAVLVPSPHVTADHQTANAAHLEAAGGAVVVPDAELDGPRLVAELDGLVGDAERRAAMAAAIRTLSTPDAAAEVAALARAHAR